MDREKHRMAELDRIRRNRSEGKVKPEVWSKERNQGNGEELKGVSSSQSTVKW